MPLIGKHRRKPGAEVVPMRFVGPNCTNTKRKRSMFNQTCLAVVAAQPGRMLAQFDDRSTGYGYGWHLFNASSFELT